MPGKARRLRRLHAVTPRFRTSPRNSRVRHELSMPVDQYGTPVRETPHAQESRQRRARAAAARTPWRRPVVTRTAA